MSLVKCLKLTPCDLYLYNSIWPMSLCINRLCCCLDWDLMAVRAQTCSLHFSESHENQTVCNPSCRLFSFFLSCGPDHLRTWSGWLNLKCILRVSWGVSHLSTCYQITRVTARSERSHLDKCCILTRGCQVKSLSFCNGRVRKQKWMLSSLSTSSVVVCSSTAHPPYVNMLFVSVWTWSSMLI